MFNIGKGYPRFIVTVALLFLFALIADIVVHFVQPIVFGLFFYYSARPIKRRLDKHLPERISVWSSAILIIVPFIILIAITVNLVAHDAVKFLHNVGIIKQGAGSLMHDIEQNVEHVMKSGNPFGTITETLKRLVPVFGKLGEVFIDFIIMITFVYYMLKDSSRVTNWFFNKYDKTGVYHRFFKATDSDLQRILFGNTLTAFVIGFVGAIIYNIFNLFVPHVANIPYPSIAGALMGVASLIPIVGMKIVYIPVGAIMAFHLWEAGELGSHVIYIVAYEVVSLIFVDSIPDTAVRAFVSSGEVHMGLIMFSYMMGTMFFGFIGLFLGPIVLTVFWNSVYILVPYALHGEPGTVPNSGDSDNCEGLVTKVKHKL
ncbi:MAG: AI-2E family transporter [Halobacteria archaeon]